MYMHYNHCHRATAHLQLNILLLLLLLYTGTDSEGKQMLVSNDICTTQRRNTVYCRI